MGGDAALRTSAFWASRYSALSYSPSTGGVTYAGTRTRRAVLASRGVSSPDDEQVDPLRRRSGVEDLSPFVLWFYRQWWPWAIGSALAALGALAQSNLWLLLVAVVTAAIAALQWRDARRR
jgi:hypothetical protein